MAIRIDDQRQIAPGQAPGQFTAPDNQGASIAARQTSALGQQVVRAADAASDIFVRELEKTNQARVNSALAQAQARAREHELEGRSFKGGNVFDGDFEETPLPDFYAGKIDEDLSEIEASLGNDAQIAAFRERAMPMRENVRLGLEDHTQTQGLAFREESHMAFAAEGKLGVEQGFQSDVQIGMGLENIRRGITDLGEIRGTAPERVEAQVAAAQSSALLGAVKQATAEEDADRVEQLWQTYRAQMLPEDRAEALALREPFEVRRFSELAVNYVFNPGGVPEGFGAQAGGDERLGFDKGFELLLPHEGTAFVADDNGAGRARYGITERSHPEAWADGDVTEAEAKAIYQRDYWEPLDLDNKPAGVARVLLDIAVNQGVGAARELYAEAGDDVEKLTDLRKQRYRGTRGFNRYGNTWMRRSDEVLREATELGGGRAGVELPPQRLPESASEAADFGRRYALAGGATESVAERAGAQAARQYQAQEQAREAADAAAVQRAYDTALANGISDFTDLPPDIQAAIPLDKRPTVAANIQNVDPARLRESDMPTWVAVQDDAYLMGLNPDQLMGVLGELSYSDQKQTLARAQALRGQGPKLPDWQAMPSGWGGTVERYAVDLDMDTEQKGTFMRFAQQAIWDWQYTNGRVMTPVEASQFVATLATRPGPEGRGRLVTTQIGQIPARQRSVLAEELKLRNGGVAASEAEVEAEYYIRVVTGQSRRSYEVGR